MSKLLISQALSPKKKSWPNRKKDWSIYGLKFLARVFVFGLGEAAFAGDPTYLAHKNIKVKRTHL